MVKLRILIILFVLTFANFSYAEENGKVIVTTTTHIQSIVNSIGTPYVVAESLIPSGMCPGHFDISPGQVKFFSSADFLLMHGFESKMFTDKILSFKGDGAISVKIVGIRGNWMVPVVHLKAAAAIKILLQELIPQKSAFFEENYQRYYQEIETKSSAIKEKANLLKTDKYTVVCSNMQKDLLQWLKLNVADTYSRPEEFTPQKIMSVIDKAKNENVSLVVDNLQSGPEAGQVIADQLGITHIVLTNFPTNSYLETFEENCDKIFFALSKQNGFSEK